MPGPKLPAVPLSEAERQELFNLIRAHKTPQHYSFRAHIILRLADGHNAPEVARRVGTSRRTVRLWRRHWLARPHDSVTERLQDAPRPGAPATFSAEQWCQIIALACEPPEGSQRPTAIGLHVNWPTRHANAALSRRFPRATWGGFYHHADLKPHRSRYWLNSEPEETADEKMADVTDLYLQAQALLDAGERVISTDEMTGIQALERKHPTIPMGPGRGTARVCIYPTWYSDLDRPFRCRAGDGRSAFVRTDPDRRGLCRASSPHGGL